MEKLIACNNFIRVNKSNIINVLKIKEIIPWFGGRILLRFISSEERIEVSRNYVKDFKQFLDM
jgi:DNA-binding LytR/AlgR family response regulator